MIFDAVSILKLSTGTSPAILRTTTPGLPMVFLCEKCSIRFVRWCLEVVLRSKTITQNSLKPVPGEFHLDSSVHQALESHCQHNA